MRLDLGIVPMLIEMRRRGVLLDTGHLSSLDAKIAGKQQAVEAEIERVIGRPFDVGSPDKVAQLLFHDLGLPPGRMTDSRKRPSTDEDSLVRLKGMHPVVDLTLEWRGLDKLRGTYLQPLPKLVDADGRLRARTKMTTARTGRLSMEEPNLQTIPIRSEDGREIRAAFVASPGCVIASLDLAQIEMVVAAHESQDPSMLEVFRKGLDIHIKTACALFHEDYNAVWNRVVESKTGFAAEDDIAWVANFWQTKRLPAKQLGFATLYGITGGGLQDQILGAGGPYWEVQDCERFIEAWFDQYAGVRAWMELQYQRAQRYGMTWCMFGRPRLIPEVRSALSWVRSSGLRQAGNQPIQSGSQGVIKLAMAEIWELVTTYQSAYPGERCWPLLQIHDELLFELSKPIAEDFCQMAKRIMETAVPLTVPVKAEYGIGASWKEAH
jgi:DNA polymerase-1